MNYFKFLSYKLVIVFALLTVSCSEDLEEYSVADPEVEYDLNTSLKSTTSGISSKHIISVDWNSTNQVIDGFGVSQAYWANFLFRHQQRDSIMSLLFGNNGLDLSILRGEVFPHYSTAQGQTNFNTNADINVPLGTSYFTNSDPYNNYEYLQRAQLWVTNSAKNSHNVEKLMFSTWSPPAWMKTNNSQTSGGKVKSEYLDDYAEYLADFVTAFEQAGYPVYGISPSNEPEYAAEWNSCLWSATEMGNFVGSQLKTSWTNRGLTNKIIVGEPAWWGIAESFVNIVLNNTSARNFIDIAAGHGYFGMIDPYQKAAGYGKKVWLTEISDIGNLETNMEDGISWAKSFHNYLVDANVNAYVFWQGARPSSNNESLIILNGDTDYTIAKRFDTFGNYSKFIRPGYVRINSTENPISGVSTSAFKDPETGEFSVVVINDNNETKSFKLNLNGANCDKVTAHLTDANNRWTKSEIYSTNNSEFCFVIPANSVVTYTGVTSEVSSSVFVDKLDDLGKVLYSNNIVIDRSSSNKFDGDAARAKRINESNGELVYSVSGVKSFTAKIYHFTGVWNGVSFYSSVDGVSWTELPHESFEGVNNYIGWFRKTYFSKQTPPEGSNFIKVVFSASGAWQKQLSEINIAYAE